MWLDGVNLALTVDAVNLISLHTVERLVREVLLVRIHFMSDRKVWQPLTKVIEMGDADNLPLGDVPKKMVVGQCVIVEK